LQASLQIKAGGELGERLNALYDYMSRRLLEANLYNKPEYIEEVLRLLGELNEAWEAIGTASTAPSTASPILSSTHNPYNTPVSALSSTAGHGQ
jgi:flagellar protein FliS